MARFPGPCGAELAGIDFFDFQEALVERRSSTCTVRTRLASFAEGGAIEEVRADFPTVSADALRAVRRESRMSRVVAR
jgi:hypothetical protein